MAPKIAVCSSSKESNVSALLKELTDACGSSKYVKFVQLPFNDLDDFRMKEGDYDGLILCHSVNDRRLAITDVMDALYNKFLAHVNDIFGREGICVIAHDFDWQQGPDHEREMENRLEALQVKQPTTFELSSLVLTCGSLGGTMEMGKNDLEKLKVFLDDVNSRPVKGHDDLGKPAGDKSNESVIPDMSPVTIAKIVVSLVLFIIVARMLASLSMVNVSLLFFGLLVVRWLLLNDVIPGTSNILGKMQNPKLVRHSWPRPNVPEVPWQKIPSKILGYYSHGDIPKSQAIFEICIRVITVLWFLVVVFGVTNYYPLIQLALVLVVMEPLGCWLWMSAGRMKKLKMDTPSPADVGTSRWFAVQYQHIPYSYWLYHVKVLATNPHMMTLLLVEINVFFCMYLILFGTISWGTLSVVMSMALLQPLGYWAFFNGGKKQSFFSIKVESPKWSRVELVQAPFSFWQDFAKTHFSSEHLRSTLVTIVNEVPWAFLVFYYDIGFMTLFRLLLVLALIPYGVQVRLATAGKKLAKTPGRSDTQPPSWTRVPIWQVPYSFWLYQGNELINNGKLFHKVAFALNIIVWLSLISFGDVGKATLVRIVMTFLLEPMANMILLAD